MRSRLVLGFAIFVLALLSAPLAHAIDIAVPGDFPYFEVTDNDLSNTGYYFSSSVVESPGQTITRPYTYIFDARGNLVWFFAQPNEEFNDNNVHYTNDQIVMASRSPNRDFVDVILDENYVPVDTIDHQNPFFDNMSLKWHGIQIMPDGTIYTVWDESRIIDMTTYGGVADCNVGSNALQQWDADHNLLWSWSALDHVDQLPFEAREDPSEILGSKFGHIHLNSFQVLPDGDIICNGRTVNTVFRIDRATGNLEWGLGGWNTPNEMDSFDFFTNLALPAEVPLEFSNGHDAYLDDNGTTLTFFDNGTYHDAPYAQRAYAKTFELDYNDWTAELTWVHWHPDDFWAQITGSHRVIEDDKHLIGWGGGRGTSMDGRPTVNATEVDADGNIIWEMKLYPNSYPDGLRPKTYRWQKLETFTPGDYPYVSHLSDPVANTIELYCNWFGHEAEVASYDVYMGLDENNLVLVDNTDDGTWMLEDVVSIQPYYFQAQPLDDQGNEIGNPSNILMVQWETTGMALTPLHTTVPAGGGNIYYAVDVVNGENTYLGNLLFRTYAETPNAITVGPLITAPFTLLPYQRITVSSLMQEVPGYAPAGDYTFSAEVTQGGNPIFSDSFSFTKEGANTAGFAFDPSEWRSGGDLSAFSETVAEVASAGLPLEYTMQAAYPNPFNPTTTINVALPAASELTVAVYNVTGQLVSTLNQGQIEAGNHSFVFDASNLASGLYFVRAMVPGELSAVQKIMLVR